MARMKRPTRPAPDSSPRSAASRSAPAASLSGCSGFVPATAGRVRYPPPPPAPPPPGKQMSVSQLKAQPGSGVGSKCIVANLQRCYRGITMPTAEKLSLSLPKDQVRWAKRMARSQNTTFSGLVSRLIEEKRQHEEALEAFDEYFGDKGRVSVEQANEIRRKWRED